MKVQQLLLATLFSCGSLASDIQQPLQNPSSVSTSDLLSLHHSLVEHASTTGSEASASRFLHSYLKERGFNVETQTVADGRENVYAYYNASRATKILVTSHIDTVPPYFPYRREGDVIWGRGAVDAKGSVATQIIAVQSLRSEGIIGEGDVSLLFVVGEERDGVGMRAANDLGLSWKAVIFGEPTELRLGRGHKGAASFTVHAKGKAGHSGYPETGKNAIDILARGLVALQGIKLPWDDNFGNTTINVGKIEGGVASNVIAANASATATVRVASGTPETIEKLVNDLLATVSPDLSLEFHGGIGRVPIDYDIEGFETVILNYGTDIPHLKGDHKRYLYGPGTILEAHSAHEHLTVKDLEEAVDGYKVLITESLKKID